MRGRPRKCKPGARFGRWTVIEVYPKTGKSLFRCDCGSELVRHNSNIVYGKSTQCTKCSGKQKGKNRTDGYSDEWRARVMYRYYFNQAKTKNRVFELSEEQCLNLSKSNCFYCGIPPAKKFTTRVGTDLWYNGIDRIDNNAGYVEGNVRPCCFVCNQAKHTLKEKDFFEWLERCYTHGKNQGLY